MRRKKWYRKQSKKISKSKSLIKLNNFDRSNYIKELKIKWIFKKTVDKEDRE